MKAKPIEIKKIILIDTPIEVHESKKHIKGENGEDFVFVTLTYRGYIKTNTTPKKFLAFLTFIVTNGFYGPKFVMTINPNNWVNVFSRNLSLKDQRLLKRYFLENGILEHTLKEERFSSLQFLGKALKQATRLYQ